MSYEFLQTLWFILIAILWIGFYFLEGFDFGVGMLLQINKKKDEERRAIRPGTQAEPRDHADDRQKHDSKEDAVHHWSGAGEPHACRLRDK